MVKVIVVNIMAQIPILFVNQHKTCLTGASRSKLCGYSGLSKGKELESIEQQQQECIGNN